MALAFAAASVLATPLATAATVGVTAPTGWTSGEPNTAHVSFDVFTATSGTIGSTTDGFVSSGLTSPTLSVVGDDSAAFGPLLFGGAAPADNRIYTGDEAMIFSLALNVAFQTNYALVQIVEHGGPNGFDSVTLGSMAPSSFSSEALVDVGKTIWRYHWDPAALSGGLASGEIELRMEEQAVGHLSFDSVTADLSRDFAPVPEPGAALLLLLAGAGLVIRRRRTLP